MKKSQPYLFDQILFFCVLIFVYSACSESAPKENVWDKKPAVLSFAELEKRWQNPSADSVYLINFWATWCDPCVKELPFFNQIAKEYRDKKIKFLFVSLDRKSMLDSLVVPFVKKSKLVAEVALLADTDFDSWINKVDTSWQGSIPSTLLYKGSHRKFYERDFTYQEIKHEVDSFLNLR